jgi:hypothetical protein
LLTIDDELADEHVPIFDRPFAAGKKWADKYGDLEIWMLSEKWFHEAYIQIHPSVDFSANSFLTLCVSARGISYIIKPPMVYGTTMINPRDHVKISENELGRIFHRHPEDFWEFQWQAFDAVDLFLAYVNFSGNSVSGNRMSTSIHQLTASARQLVASEMDSSMPQGLSMACELAGKALLVNAGVNDTELRSIGHDLSKLHSIISSRFASPLDAVVGRLCAEMPRYSAVRYDAPKMTIRDAQDLYRRAMFIVADFLRRTNHQQMTWGMADSGNMPKREI